MGNSQTLDLDLSVPQLVSPALAGPGLHHASHTQILPKIRSSPIDRSKPSAATKSYKHLANNPNGRIATPLGTLQIIPPEIRLQINRHVLVSAGPPNQKYSVNSRTCILATSRAIKAETLPELYSDCLRACNLEVSLGWDGQELGELFYSFNDYSTTNGYNECGKNLPLATVTAGYIRSLRITFIQEERYYKPQSAVDRRGNFAVSQPTMSAVWPAMTNLRTVLFKTTDADFYELRNVIGAPVRHLLRCLVHQTPVNTIFISAMEPTWQRTSLEPVRVGLREILQERGMMLEEAYDEYMKGSYEGWAEQGDKGDEPQMRNTRFVLRR